jgi:hypothetical protein
MKPLLCSTSTLVERLHVVFGGAALLPALMIGAHVGEGRQGPFIDDALLADLAPARQHGRVVGVGQV